MMMMIYIYIYIYICRKRLQVDVNPGSYVSFQSLALCVGLWVLHTYSSETVLRTAELSVPLVRMKIMEIHKIYYFNISGSDSYSFLCGPFV